MEYKTKNTYKVHFKDGTSFDSSGSSSSIKRSTIDKEFEWVSFHIKKEVISMGKDLKDVEKIEYTLIYSQDLNQKA